MLLLASSGIALILLLPLVSLCFNVFKSPQGDLYYLLNTVMLEYSLNTFYIILIAGSVTLFFGVIPAWLISIYEFRFRYFFDLALYLPLAIPTYIMAFSYSDLLSYTGFFQVFIRHNIPIASEIVNQDYIQIEILGCLLGFALYPYVYTASRVSFSFFGESYIQTAKNLGLSNNQIFRKVLLPISRPAIVSGLFLVIMEILNEYGAVKYFGVNTFTTGIFRAWFSLGNEVVAIQLAFFLVFFVFIILIFEKRSQKSVRYFYKANTSKLTLQKPFGAKRFYIYLLCAIPFLLGFVIPFSHILINSLHQFNAIDFGHLFLLCWNSVKIATLSAIIIVLIALFLLFVEKLSKHKINSLINQTTSLGYVIPGAVIGLGIILLFTQIPFLQSLPLIGSFFVLVYAYVFRFLAVGKSPIKSSLEKQPESFDYAAKNLGLSPLKILYKIHLPISKTALVISFIVTFIDLLKELPITLILRPFNFDTLATQTYEFAVEEMLEKSSIYSLAIVLIGSSLLILLKHFTHKEINASKS
tara:strand:- start:2920 stop:4500 length:1581 start_codon:yes stop_codon:yes gene_type:complete